MTVQKVANWKCSVNHLVVVRYTSPVQPSTTRSFPDSPQLAASHYDQHNAASTESTGAASGVETGIVDVATFAIPYLLY
jgi:hypothetical protein